MLHRTYTQCGRHILTVAQRLQGGGVERAMLRMADGWLRAGHRVTLVLGSREGPLVAEIPDGLEVRELGDGTYKALFSLADHVRDVRPDVIFCPGNHYSGIAAITRWKLGSDAPPIVAKVSNALVRPEQGAIVAWAYRRWLRLHPRFIDALVAMTPAMAVEAQAAMAMPADRIHVIANPPALPRVGVAPVALPDGRFVIGVGRLEPQKRWDRLFAALPRLEERQIKLLILGEGSARPALEAQVEALGLTGRVRMPGHAGDPLPALKAATLAVLTSDYEGVPGVLREALSVGTPVVTTDSSVAVREIVASPDLGTVVGRDDADGLVAALNHWLRPDVPRPQPMVANGDPIADYLSLFDRLIEAKAKP